MSEDIIPELGSEVSQPYGELADEGKRRELQGAGAMVLSHFLRRFGQHELSVQPNRDRTSDSISRRSLLRGRLQSPLSQEGLVSVPLHFEEYEDVLGYNAHNFQVAVDRRLVSREIQVLQGGTIGSEFKVTDEIAVAPATKLKTGSVNALKGPIEPDVDALLEKQIAYPPAFSQEQTARSYMPEALNQTFESLVSDALAKMYGVEKVDFAIDKKFIDGVYLPTKYDDLSEEDKRLMQHFLVSVLMNAKVIDQVRLLASKLEVELASIGLGKVTDFKVKLGANAYTITVTDPTTNEVDKVELGMNKWIDTYAEMMHWAVPIKVPRDESIDEVDKSYNNTTLNEALSNLTTPGHESWENNITVGTTYGPVGSAFMDSILGRLQIVFASSEEHQSTIEIQALFIMEAFQTYIDGLKTLPEGLDDQETRQEIFGRFILFQRLLHQLEFTENTGVKHTNAAIEAFIAEISKSDSTLALKYEMLYAQLKSRNHISTINADGFAALKTGAVFGRSISFGKTSNDAYDIWLTTCAGRIIEKDGKDILESKGVQPDLNRVQVFVPVILSNGTEYFVDATSVCKLARLNGSKVTTNIQLPEEITYNGATYRVRKATIIAPVRNEFTGKDENVVLSFANL